MIPLANVTPIQLIKNKNKSKMKKTRHNTKNNRWSEKRKYSALGPREVSRVSRALERRVNSATRFDNASFLEYFPFILRFD